MKQGLWFPGLMLCVFTIVACPNTHEVRSCPEFIAPGIIQICDPALAGRWVRSEITPITSTACGTYKFNEDCNGSDLCAR